MHYKEGWKNFKIHQTKWSIQNLIETTMLYTEKVAANKALVTMLHCTDNCGKGPGKHYEVPEVTPVHTDWVINDPQSWSGRLVFTNHPSVNRQMNTTL
jgi:hypothetical protein